MGKKFFSKGFIRIYGKEIGVGRMSLKEII